MKKILTVASIAMLWASGAWAVGTAAGTTITNGATLTYSVSGAAQPPVSTQTDDSFVVDKKIDFIVTHEDNPKHLIVVPNQQDAVRTFKLTNQGNKIQDFTFVATNLTGNEVYDGKTDNKDVTNFEYSIDGGTTWSTTPPTIDNLVVDGDINILVRADIPNTNVNGDVMNIQLEATAVQDGTTNPEVNTGATNGAIDGGADRKGTEDTVLGEGDGVTDFANQEFNGKYSTWAGYIIEAPVLSLSKTSCVLEDPVFGNTNPKRIPGATILYVLDVKNEGSVDATGITITDALQSDLDYGTVANVKILEDQATACSCVDGTAGSGAGSANNGTSPNVVINIVNVAAPVAPATENHTCVSFEVDIK